MSSFVGFGHGRFRFDGKKRRGRRKGRKRMGRAVLELLWEKKEKKKNEDSSKKCFSFFFIMKNVGNFGGVKIYHCEGIILPCWC